MNIPGVIALKTPLKDRKSKQKPTKMVGFSVYNIKFRFIMLKFQFTNIPDQIIPPDTEIIAWNFDFVKFSGYTQASLL